MSSNGAAPLSVALVVFEWFPHGGLQRDLLAVAEALVAPGSAGARAEVTVLCMRWSGPRPDGVDVVELPAKGWSAVRRRARFVRAVRRRAGDFDRVVGFQRMPGLDVYFAADPCFHAKAFGERGALYRLAPRTRQYLAWERAVFAPEARTRILLLSPRQRREYQAAYGTPDARMVELGPSIDAGFLEVPLGGAHGEAHGQSHGPTHSEAHGEAHGETHSEAHGETHGETHSETRGEAHGQGHGGIRVELGIPMDARVVLQVGPANRTKGWDRTLAALGALPAELAARTHFVHVGAGGARALGGSPDPSRAGKPSALGGVHALGVRDDVPALMAAADLLVHPSRSEAAGKVLVEALAAGLAVLTTAESGYAFHVAQAGAGHVCAEPFAQAELDAALARLVALPTSELAALRTAARRYAASLDLHGQADAVARAILEADSAAGR